MDIWYNRLFIGCLIMLAVIMVIYVVRSIVGPVLADRILAVNAIGTLTIVAVAILAVSKQESYLLDVCMVYAMLSFLALVVLTALMTKERLERLDEQKENEEKMKDKKEKEGI